MAYAEVSFDATYDKLLSDDPLLPKKFLEAVSPGAKPGGLELHVTTLVAEQALGSEAIGLVFAAFVLLLAFGSALAMGLPIIAALFGLGIGSTLGGIASRLLGTPEWAATVAAMIGLGVGIDYALFIITRYRQALDGGLQPREAVATAMGTAGRAVLFAGGTVVISLLGMLTMGLGYLQGVAGSAVVSVLVMLAASLTLLPAILGFVGENIDRGRAPVVPPAHDRLPVAAGGLQGRRDEPAVDRRRLRRHVLRRAGSWLGDLLSIPETPIPAFIPMIMFAFLFGLSMDYEVFLLSRIREEYLRSGDNGAAVADGLAMTARVITAAAAIMVFVFGVFIFDPNTFIKQIGLGLTTAVLVDATVVRMLLVPATMELLGDANWWMPRWLDRILPNVHIEGEAAVQTRLTSLPGREGVAPAALT